MKSINSLYFLVLHLVIFVLVLVVLWQFTTNYSTRVTEAEIVAKYRPVMQQLSDDLGVGITIETYEDLMAAFVEIISGVKGQETEHDTVGP